MEAIKRFLGAAILFVLFGGIFYLVAQDIGVVGALAIFAVSGIASGFFILGIYLLVG